MDFAKQLRKKTEAADRWVRAHAPSGGGYHAKIFEAVNYAVGTGGKRIRPVLSLAVCEMLGGKEEDVVPLACAVEYIHTYSLLHDDLPCMDNDDTRRGMPACHVKYGEAIALLAGDALLGCAFETVVRAALTAETKARAVELLAAAAGPDGMIGGQVIDIEGAADYEELVTLCRMKTAALITAAAEMGVLASGNQNEAVRGAVTEYAEKLGVAFQIKDDLLDVEGDASLMGKRVGGDAAAGKKTFVTFLGRDGARDALAEYTRGAKDALRRFGDRAEFLLSTADYLLDRNQ